MTRIAVASRSFSRHPVLRRELQERCESVTFNDAGESLSGPALIDYLSGHDKAITALERLDHAVFSALPDLKVIAKYGVGLDMIDLDAMRRFGVELGWTPGVNRRAVAELVISFAVSLLRHVPAASREVLDGTWRQVKGRQLTGKTVGIIGCGHVGKDVVRLLQPFGCRVLANDILDFADFYAEFGVEALDIETLLARADIVTIHTPLDETTHNILSAERLSLMRPDAVLLNLARGGLVDEAALRGMLMGGRLAAAAFDVFAEEPPTDRTLLALPNFLATPHIGGSSEEAIVAMGRAAIAGLDDHGDPLEIANR